MAGHWRDVHGHAGLQHPGLPVQRKFHPAPKHMRPLLIGVLVIRKDSPLFKDNPGKGQPVRMMDGTMNPFAKAQVWGSVEVKPGHSPKIRRFGGFIFV